MSSTRNLFLALAATAGFVSVAHADPQATMVLVNLDQPNVGLNDPTPVQPVGGNPGTTLGEQRRLALQHAANIWARNLRSYVPVRMQVSFTTRPCTATGAVLASAGPLTADLNFHKAKLQDVWYHSAVANNVAKEDRDPEEDDLIALFNINLGQPGCLAGSPFYYGFDHNEGNGVDLITTALHEFGHGLGFAQLGNVANGTLFMGLPDVYNRNLVDESTGLAWDAMTDAERRTASVNSRKVVWVGPNVTRAVPQVLAFGVPLLRVTAPASIAGSYDVGTASFGGALTGAGISGQLVAATDAADGAGPSTSDACSAITNASAISGRLALVDRGTCGFIVKVKNLQDAGAVAAVIADNAPGSPPAGLGGVDPTIFIPAVRITLADGNTIKAQLASGVASTLALDETRLAGASDNGSALMNAPNPVVPGSSISHWDPIASPNLLMEPSINSDLTSDLDLTNPLLRDIGWLVD